MTKRVSVAVVGATGVVGEPLLTTLEARKFPVESLYCLDMGDAVGGSLRYFGKSLSVESVADFDFTQVQLVFFCGDADLSGRYVHLATEAGCTVIDCSGAFSADYDVPLVIPSVNPEALEDCRPGCIIANPSATTISLLLVLKPLHDAVGIERVNLTVLEPVSVEGKAGIDELAGQTVALLNMQKARNRVFSRQIAFNLIPQIGTPVDNGYTDAEMRVVWETQKVLDAGIRLNPTSVLVPLFYGLGMAVHLESRGHLSVTDACALLSGAPGLRLHSEDVPTPVDDATKSEVVHVGRVREDIANSQGLNLWITADNVRTAAALNAVRIAELWVKCYT